MTKSLYTLFACAVLWLAISHGALGQERYALLIGNWAYSKKIGELRNPVNDIQLIKNALIQVGFKEENIDVRANAKQGTITRAVKLFGQKMRAAGPDALGFFYYSGHGAAGKIAETGETLNYITPIDVDEAKGIVEMFASSVAVKDIINILRPGTSFSNLIIVFDACRNEFNMNLRSIDSKTFVAVPFAPPDSLLGFSTDAASPASDAGEGGGPFAKALAQELVRADQYHEQVFYNVKQAVIQTTLNRQRPYYLDQIGKRLYFVEKSRPVDPTEVSDWGDARGANTPEAYRKFIQLYPGSSFAREAMRRELERQEEIDWNVAYSSGRRDDLFEFVSRHSNGRFYDQARDQLDALMKAEEDRDWRSVRNSTSEEEILAFLDKYPNTKRRNEIRDIYARLRQSANETRQQESLEKAEWEEAQRLDNIPAYSRYLGLFGEMAHAQLARQRLAELIELRDWHDARDSKLIGRLQKFLKEHPAGPYAEDARELIASLSGPQQLTEKAETKGISEEFVKEKNVLSSETFSFREGHLEP